MKKKRHNFLKLPQSDKMIRLVSFLTALLIVAVPLSARRIFPRRQEKQSAGLYLELICGNTLDAAMWKQWAKQHDPQELYAFSRSPQLKYTPLGGKYLEGDSRLRRFTPDAPTPHALALARLPELPALRRTVRVEAIPRSLRRYDYELPVLRALEICGEDGRATGMTIDPVPFRGKAGRCVLFKFRTGRFGDDLQILHSSGDRRFDVAVRRKMLQRGIPAEASGKIFSVWPQTAVKEKNL